MLGIFIHAENEFIRRPGELGKEFDNEYFLMSFSMLGKSKLEVKIPGVGGHDDSGNMTEADGRLGSRPEPGTDDGRRGSSISETSILIFLLGLCWFGEVVEIVAVSTVNIIVSFLVRTFNHAAHSYCSMCHCWRYHSPKCLCCLMNSIRGDEGWR